MRVILRQYPTIATTFVPIRYNFCTSDEVASHQTERNLQPRKNRGERFTDFEENYTMRDYFKQQAFGRKKHLRQAKRNRDENEVTFENEWELKNHLLVGDYNIFEKQNRKDTLETLMNYYELKHGFTIDNFIKKIYNDSEYISKMAQYNLTETTKITGSFIRQGHNFVDKRVLKFIIKNDRIKILKELMREGAFERANYIDRTVVDLILEQYQKNPRNIFMINLLAYEQELISGFKPRNPALEVDDVKEVLQKFQEVQVEQEKTQQKKVNRRSRKQPLSGQSNQAVLEEKINSLKAMKQVMTAQNKQNILESLFTKILYDVQGSKQVNRLRFLWSCQRYYLYRYQLSDYIIPQLKKIQFRLANQKGKSENLAFKKEVNDILGNTFTHASMVSLFYELINLTRTYENFIKAYSLIIILLSKVKSIRGLLDDSKTDELNYIFKLIEFNLPSNVAQIILNHTIKNLLATEGNYWMFRVNYQKCLQNWSKDFSKKAKSSYNSPFNILLEDQKNDISITYQLEQSVEPYSKTILYICKNELRKDPVPKSQIAVINDLLKGNYQSVFDDFLVRYSLPSNYDLATKFHYELDNIDKTLKFKNKQQEALYKLKFASSFFFTESFTPPYSYKYLHFPKMNIEVAALKDRQLLEDEFFQSDDQINVKAEKLEETISDYLYSKYGIVQKSVPDDQYDLIPQPFANQIQEACRDQLLKVYEDNDYENAFDEVDEKEVQEYNIKKDPELLVDFNKEMQVIEKDDWLLSPRQINFSDNDEPENVIDLDEEAEELPKFDLSISDMENSSEDIQFDPSIITAEKMFMKQLRLQTTDDASKFIKKILKSGVMTAYQIQQIPDLNFSEGLKSIRQGIKRYQEYLAYERDLAEREKYINELKQLNGKENRKQLRKLAQERLKLDNKGEQDTFTDVGLTYTEFNKIKHEMIKISLEANPIKDQDKPFSKRLQNLQDNEYSLHKNINVNKPLFGQHKNKNEAKKQGEAQEDDPWSHEMTQTEQQYLEKQLGDAFTANDAEIDAARDDRALKFAFNMQNFQNPFTMKTGKESFQEAAQQLDPTVTENLNQDQLRNLIESRAYKNYLLEIYSEASTTKAIDIETSKMMFEDWEKLIAQAKEYRKTNPSLQSEQNDFEDKRYLGNYGNKYQQKKKKKPFERKLKYSFSTTSGVPESEGNQVQPEIENEIQTENLFDIDKIEQYRTETVSQDFLKLMKNETQIPQIGEGLTIAKYLFLHGKRQDKKMTLDSSKQMDIEFTSVVGTRGKSYSEYVVSTLYPYELEDSFYDSMLQDQVAKFNRYEFKQIIAHMIYFKNKFTDDQVSLFCQLCQKFQIGYTFVEIVQFIKANDIYLSEEAIEKICHTWQRFALINQDLLPFLREYCKKMSIPFRTKYYSKFCTSLIKKQNFEKLEALTSSVLAEIKPKPFRVTSNMKSHEVPKLEKAWKEVQQQNYITLYLEMLEVIVSNLSYKIPTFLLNLYVDYLKLRPEPNEKELGYGFVCSCTDKTKFNTLLKYLEQHPKLGTEFIYDCLMQSILSNQYKLEQYIERILDASVFVNRIILTHERIKKIVYIFKRTNSSNSFSKFLEHCLRFQVDINQHDDIKKQMFYILNNKIDDVSVTGVYNLLDFIFNPKREEERAQYRKIKLQEEQKEKRLAQIQSKPNENQTENTDKTESETIQTKEESVQQKKQEEKELSKKEKQKQSKKQIKQQKKAVLSKKTNLKNMSTSILTEMESTTQETVAEGNDMGDETEVISVLKRQSKKHESYRRKGVQSFNQLYRPALEAATIEEESKDDKKKGKGKKKK